MPKRYLRRSGRVVARLWRSWFVLQRTGRMISGGLALLGIGAASFFHKDFAAWLRVDGGRGVALSLLILLIAALLALYGVEAEKDEPLSVEVIANPWEHLPLLPYGRFDGVKDMAKNLRLFPAFLRVTNEGNKHLIALTAKGYYKNSEGNREAIPCVWSETSNDQFVQGGSHKADISAGDSRLLLIAEAAQSNTIWLKLPSDKPFDEMIHTDAKYRSLRGMCLNLFHTVVVEINFKTEGVQQAKKFRLSFTAKNAATVTPV